MKRLTLIALSLLLFAAQFCWAAKVHDVANTVHNLSSTGLLFQYAATDEDQICIFCHTPHGGNLDAPLWNRDSTSLSGSGVFTHYTSATLSSDVGLSNRAVNSESLACMSCHDGSIGVGDIINTSGLSDPDNSVVDIQGFGGQPGPRIGATIADTLATGDLSDDHPISFSMAAVISGGEPNLKTVANAETAGLMFYGGASKNVECATCHDPHVLYEAFYGGDEDYRPFLRIPNTGSAMCLACHDK